MVADARQRQPSDGAISRRGTVPVVEFEVAVACGDHVSCSTDDGACRVRFGNEVGAGAGQEADGRRDFFVARKEVCESLLDPELAEPQPADRDCAGDLSGPAVAGRDFRACLSGSGTERAK